MFDWGSTRVTHRKLWEIQVPPPARPTALLSNFALHFRRFVLCALQVGLELLFRHHSLLLLAHQCPDALRLARNRCVLGIGCPFLGADLAALDFAALAESGHVAWAWVAERQLALYGRLSWGTGRPGLGTCVLDMCPPTRTTAAPAPPHAAYWSRRSALPF